MKMYEVATFMERSWTPTLAEARILAKQIVKQEASSSVTINKYVADEPISVGLLCSIMNGCGWANEIEQLEVWERDDKHPSGLKCTTSR